MRATGVWPIAAAVYFLAVFHRASLGVAGLGAAERFAIGPAALGVFTVLQLAVYACAQVPAGLLADRYGPRRVLTVAACLLGAGQLLFAVAGTYPLALLARGVLGIGDALTFVSVLRLVAARYPARRYATLATLTAAVGAIGNLAATVPLTLLLDGVGWAPTFLVAGAATIGYAVVVALRVPEVPVSRVNGRRGGVWSVAGTRLGFWTHFATMFGPGVLALLWGVPYLVRGQGFTPEAAGTVLGMLVVVALVGSPVVGVVAGRWPGARIPMVACYLAAALAAWLVVLLWPGGVLPGPVAVAVFAVVAAGSPVSNVAFTFARDANPVERVGTASGVVNVGGFTAITTSALAVGLLLDGTPMDAGAFRVAFTAVVAVLLLGAWRVAVWARRSAIRPARAPELV